MTPWLYFRCPIDAQKQANRLGNAVGLLFTALCHHADEHGSCFPSQEKLADFTGLSKRAIAKAVPRLEISGLIKVTRAAGKRVANQYYLPSVAALATPEANEEPRSLLDGRSSELRSPELDPIRKPKNEKGARKRACGTAFDPLAGALPFDTPRFREAWSDFCDHRQSINHPLTPVAARRILAKRPSVKICGSSD